MVALIVHGGAWNIPDEAVEAHLEGCRKAISAGWRCLMGGGTALEAVEKSIMVMEDDGTFDAGRGSFLNADGMVELDASIMDGRTLDAGAVASVQRVRHPIQVARYVLKSPHVLLVGEGAARFAQESGLELCDPADLISEREMARWQAFRSGQSNQPQDIFARDTVGAVAQDHWGDIAAGTSTGGSPSKHPGRVGDSPLIGCGTYADNERGGVSTTGWGEAMIRVVMAKTTVDLLGSSADAMAAAQAAIDLLYSRVQGLGGVIALDRQGRVGWAFNTPRMARAHMCEGMSEPVAATEHR
jgi:beta-aspartyl-peptidase (threonine type)